MYRFFCKKSRLLSLFLCYVVGTGLIYLIFDDSLPHKKADVQNRVEILKTASVSQSHVHNFRTVNHLVKTRAKPLMFKRRNQGKLFKGLVKKDTNDVKSRKESKMAVLKKSEKEWIPPPNPGEGGLPVTVKGGDLSGAQMKWYRQGLRSHHFNQFLSDHISLHRAVPKLKDPECLKMQYRSDLPQASVVIIFHNEAWSTLLRTVHSVLDRSPPHLLHEIILVDDLSDMDHLKKPLDDYLRQPGLSKVTVIRSPARDGLMEARLLGLSHANTSAVVFLDSHCECFEGWLEPLLDRIARDPSTVVLPVIDVIDSKTFAIFANDALATSVGTFTWDLQFNWMPIQPSEKLRRKSAIDPVRSPTMAGGLFVIDRDFFYKLGTYDPGMKIWGGENLELSFKIWMCGGTMEIVPCSHVGHVFRTTSPHSPGIFKNYISVNLARVVTVWMDRYSYYNYNITRASEKHQLEIAGNISERLELKRRLKCHSFGWFMKYVMPEIYLPADYIAHGQIVNYRTGLCITEDDKAAVLERCPFGQDIRSELLWYMSPGRSAVFTGGYALTTNQICLDYNAFRKHTVGCRRCHGTGGNQHWKYFQDRKQLYHVVTKMCAEVGPALPSDKDQDFRKVIMAACDPSNPLQHWSWDTNPLPGPSWRRDEAAGKLVI